MELDWVWLQNDLEILIGSQLWVAANSVAQLLAGGHLARSGLQWGHLARSGLQWGHLARSALLWGHLARSALQWGHLARSALQWGHLARSALQWGHLARFAMKWDESTYKICSTVRSLGKTGITSRPWRRRGPKCWSQYTMNWIHLYSMRSNNSTGEIDWNLSDADPVSARLISLNTNQNQKWKKYIG